MTINVANTSLIINMPHLQSARQRWGAHLFSVLCWLYFLVPIVIVAGWLIGVHQLARSVVWLGGFSSLRAMVTLTAEGIVALAAIWAVWTLYLALRAPVATDKPELIDDFTVSRHFRVDRSAVEAARRATITTVHFAPSGQIIAIEPEALPRLDVRPSLQRWPLPKSVAA